MPLSLTPPKPAGSRHHAGESDDIRDQGPIAPPLAPNPAVDAGQAFRPQQHKVDTEANRRTITVLFADLSGFTAMSEQLDPEVMQTLQNELFEELTAAVQDFGGFVDKFIGDALLALFGAPAAHEDDPERAVRAALDMIRRTAQLGERSKAYAGSPLHAPYRHQHRARGGGRIRCGQLPNPIRSPATR